MDDQPPPPMALPAAAWVDVLERSEAEAAAGMTVPASVVHQQLREGIARVEARLLAKAERETTPSA